MTRCPKEDFQPIIDMLNDIRQQTGWSRRRAFDTVIDLTLATLQRDDDAYRTHVEAVDRDADAKPILEGIGRIFGELLQTTTTETDVLGAVYEHYSHPSEEFGQYFTPPNLARSMAALQLITLNSDRAITQEDPLRIADPACGSGRLLLAAGHFLKQESEPIPVLFCGQDKDPLCAQMTAINLALNGLPGYVTYGDSLTLEATTTWKIDPARGLVQGPIQEIDPIPIGPSTPTTTPRSPAGKQSELSAFSQHYWE